ncbi:hypothetical protein EDB83DRAFT_252451 [Lactarius deliciosus]|nr:hypothetical protein EDB83DRAFT_252451 [Lactarius deliciosus]
MASSHKAPARNRPKSGLPPTPKALRALVSKIDAKTLHAYVLAHLPTAPPDTLTALASFFATLGPAPRLHCVRCHSDYIEAENDDRSCHVPHDNSSGEIEYVGMGRSGSEYETHFSCCGTTVEGDEDPPDGWCYEGMHTTDVKRARFREDSTSDDDMLESCDELDCHIIRSPSPPPATSREVKRRRRACQSGPLRHPWIWPTAMTTTTMTIMPRGTRRIVLSSWSSCATLAQWSRKPWASAGPRPPRERSPRGRSLRPACALMHLAAQAARGAARLTKSDLPLASAIAVKTPAPAEGKVRKRRKVAGAA